MMQCIHYYIEYLKWLKSFSVYRPIHMLYISRALKVCIFLNTLSFPILYASFLLESFYDFITKSFCK